MGTVAALLAAGMTVAPAHATDTTPTPTPTPTSSATDTQDAIRDRLEGTVRAAEQELGRGLTYEDTQAATRLRTLTADARQLLTDTGVDADRLEQADVQLQTVLDAVRGTSVQQRQFTQTVQRAQALDEHEYLPAGWAAVQAALDEANQVDVDTATAARFDTARTRLEHAISGLVTAMWTFQGEQLHYDEETDSFSLTMATDPKDQLTVTGPDGQSFTLTGPDAVFAQGADTLGVGMMERELHGTTPGGQQVSVHVAEPAGTATTVHVDGLPTPPTAFTLTDNVWTARADAANLLGSTPTKDGAVSDVTAWQGHDATLSDGTRLHATLGPVTLAQGEHGKRTWTRDVTYTGRDAHGTVVRVIVTASHTYDPSAQLTLTATNGDGASADVWSSGMRDATALPEAITLDALDNTRIGERYQLTVGGVDPTANTVRDTHVANSLGSNGERVFTVSYTVDRLNGTSTTPVARTVTVRQPFNPPAEDTTPTLAVLDGFMVNGQPLAGFKPTVTMYTITAKQGEKVTVTPVAGAGVKVVAGASRQTAYTTVQTWQVTGPDGSTRTYTVTLVREHTDKTADERFEPPTPTGQVSDKDNPSETNTQLVSYGYTLDGEYHPQESATFTIPEHGVLAWRSYAGQVVQPTGTRMHGMTWKYDLDVLAADHTTYGRTTLTVTYLTHDTHRAGLTGIKLDGHPIDGFTPDRLEYTVPVDNPDRYVLTPVFDKMTGMSVSVDKHGHDATIETVSADGLTTVTYRVHVTAKTPVDQVKDALAATGTTTSVLIWASVALAVVGLGALAATMITRRRHTTPDPTNGDGVSMRDE